MPPGDPAVHRAEYALLRLTDALKPFWATRIFQHVTSPLKVLPLHPEGFTQNPAAWGGGGGGVWVPQIEIKAVELQGNLCSHIIKSDSSQNNFVTATPAVI